MKKSTAVKKVETEAATTVKLVRAIRVEIAKPLGTTWDDLGDLLHDRRVIMHRLINAGTAHLWSSRYRDEKARALEAIKRELASFQEWCSKQAARTKDPIEKERFTRRAEMVLASSITDAVQTHCVDQVNRWFKEGGSTRVPSAKKGAPIRIRDGGWALTSTGDGMELGLKLVGATPEMRQPGMVKVAIRASSGKHHAALRQIIAGRVKAGDCKLVYDEKKNGEGSKGKWYAILTYTEERALGPAPSEKGRVLIVHRGMRNFLYALCTDGRIRSLKGQKFLAIRKQLKKRAEDYKGIAAFERGQGAKGHGVARRFEPHDALDNKLKKVTKTYCQQSAAWVMKVAKDLGCEIVYVEKYGGQQPDEDRAVRRFVDHFPYFQLKSSIEWVCKRDGVTLREYAASFVSTTCPACGAQDTSAHNTRTNVFHCRVCDFERSADWVATFNAGRIAGVDLSSIVKDLKHSRQIAAQLRKGEARAVTGESGAKRAVTEDRSQTVL